MNDFSIAFWIGSIPIPWYGLLLTAGFLLASFSAYIEWRLNQYSRYHWTIIFFGGGLFALFGARWWYLIFHPAAYDGRLSIFYVSSGRSILGSIFFSMLFIYFYVYYFAPDIEWRRVFSIILPNFLLAQAIGRWGNFFTQDVYGLVMEDPSFLPAFIQDGMYITSESGEGAYYHPLFLYESIINLAGWLFITFIIKVSSKFKPGTHAGFYFLWYGITRASMELFRAEEFIMRLWGLPSSFILAILFALFGIWIIMFYQFFYERTKLWFFFNSSFKKEEISKNTILIFNFLVFKVKYDKLKIIKSQNRKIYNTKASKINFKKKRELITTINRAYQPTLLKINNNEIK